MAGLLAGKLPPAEPTPVQAQSAPAARSLALDGTGAAEADLNLTADWTVELWLKDADPNGFAPDYRYLPSIRATASPPTRRLSVAG